MSCISWLSPRQGRVREAAETMHISQPAVSRRVISLERQLGVQLFHRTPSGMIITPAGDHLREMALDMRNRIRRAEGVMRGITLWHPVVHVDLSGNDSSSLHCPLHCGGRTGCRYPDGHTVRGLRGAEERRGRWPLTPSEPPPNLAAHTLSSTLIQVQYSGTPPFQVKNGNAELADVVRYPVLLPGYGRAVESQVRLTADRAGLDL
ncbi:LysR family transcriptional regulator [Arthrobacter sp. K5]|uniref:LysR family transcriptional regulator n=1 Tax=Arthrobacter sp. K5 TaxID=2839623 RepID=A0AAU8EWB4_9MICC